MWPFKRKTPAPDGFEPVRAPPPPAEKKKEPSMVEVGEVKIILILDTGERESFVVHGRLVGCKAISAMTVLRDTIEGAHLCGFFGFGREGDSARWIPTRRVKEILTTEWPHEVPVE
jgi:hypothetical protein